MKKINVAFIVFIYLFVNCLFVFKYSMRLCNIPWGITIFYCLFIIVLSYFVFPHLLKITHPKRWIWIIGGCALLGGIGLQYSINPFSLQVDRWSAIHFWIQNFFSGKYPYGAQTHLNGYGSPFPVWQFIHIPFYWMGNVALSAFVACIAWIYTTTKTISPKAGLINLLGLVLAPAFWYEIATRSDLMTNMIVSAIIVQWLLYKKYTLTNNTIKIGIIAGLLLSTRLISIIPLCVAFGYEFFMVPWLKKIKVLATGIGTFIATFLPFVFWKDSTLLFFQYNPFVLQTRQGNSIIFIIWVIFACTWIFIAHKKSFHYSFSTGVLLFVLITLAFISNIYKYSFESIFTSSTFDITYFSCVIPFVILYLSSFNTNSKEKILPN